jgi:hypothetical protein
MCSIRLLSTVWCIFVGLALSADTAETSYFITLFISTNNSTFLFLAPH